MTTKKISSLIIEDWHTHTTNLPWSIHTKSYFLHESYDFARYIYPYLRTQSYIVAPLAVSEKSCSSAHHLLLHECICKTIQTAAAAVLVCEGRRMKKLWKNANNPGAARVVLIIISSCLASLPPTHHLHHHHHHHRAWIERSQESQQSLSAAAEAAASANNREAAAAAKVKT